MDVPNLILYSFQQLGVMFAVGAQTVILVAYLLAVRNGVVDEQEERFAKAVKRVLFVGLFLIVISGLAITALELFAAHQPVVLSPAYLFKWCLIALGVVFARATWGNSLPKGLLEGASGATWYALFSVHILAPVASWAQLLMLYAVWLIVFVLAWTGLVFALRGKRSAVATGVFENRTTKVVTHFPAGRQVPVVMQPIRPVQPAQPVRPTQPTVAPTTVVPKTPHPVMPVVPFRATIPENLPVFTKDSPMLPTVSVLPTTATPAPAPNIAAQSGTPGLPGLHVMPKTAEELQKILAHL